MLKILLLLLYLVHGLIHLLGFVKAFDLAKIEQFTVDIPKPIGIMWLLTTLLFLIVAVLYLMDKEYVWIPAALALIMSQFLIVLSWQDAKFGTVANLIIIVFVILAFGNWQFNNQIDREIDLLFPKTHSEGSQIVQKEMFTELPEPIQKWLNHAGVIGKEIIQSAFFEQKAQMKLKPEQDKFYPAKVEQYVNIEKPAFLWNVNMKMFSFIPVSGRDKFQDGRGAMTIKIGSLIPVVNATNNQKIDQSTLQRFLMELVWYPTAALSPYITWEEVDRNTATATMSYSGVTGSATYYFDEDGNFLKVIAFRYKDSDENAVQLECRGEAKEYGVMDGINIPTQIEITWVLEDQLFTWYEVEVLHVEYNNRYN